LPGEQKRASAARRAALAAAAIAWLAASGAARAQAPVDLERGRALYENHCVVCHTSKVHRRMPPSAIDREALRFIVKVWVEENRLRWGEEEIDDVVHYLDRAYYHFPR
jgi:mono/diheme cytochrome c family protein